MTTSGEINKIARKVVTPVLKDLGFSNFRGRTAWRYLEDSVWVFNMRSVGNHFSQCAGFPPSSLTAWLGIFYLNFPYGPAADTDDDGLLIPKESICHVRYGLENIVDQMDIRALEMQSQERIRKDIWWVDSEGSNAEEVLSDIGRSIREYGIPLLLKPYNTREVQLERRS
jgi:hypothetical protein